MLEGKFEPMHVRVLVVDDELRDDTAEGGASRALVTDLRELEHRTYSALVGSSTLDTLEARIASMHLTANTEPVASYEVGMTAVASGHTDVLFGDRAQLLQAVQRSPAAKDLRVLSRHFTFVPVALALARNDDDFRLAVDRGLTQVYADPQFGALYTATFGAPDADTVAFFRSVAVAN